MCRGDSRIKSVIILRAGKVLLHEKIMALRKRFPRSVYLASRQGSDALAKQITNMGKVARIDGQGVWLAMAEPEQEVPVLLRGLLASGLDVYESHIVEPSLEQMFLEFMEEAER